MSQKPNPNLAQIAIISANIERLSRIAQEATYRSGTEHGWHDVDGLPVTEGQYNGRRFWDSQRHLYQSKAEQASRELNALRGG